MFDKYLNATPTFYKWDKFWVGVIPALIVPFIGLAGLILLAYLNSTYNRHEEFTLQMFMDSLYSNVTFMRVSTVCCMMNGIVFFFFVQKGFNNASRGVIVTTMLFVLAILIKEIL